VRQVNDDSDHIRKDLDEAISIASRVPVVSVGTIEIRPVLEIAGLPAEGEHAGANSEHSIR
jgi:hypothetical protein